MQHTSIPTEGVNTLRKRQSSLPITPLFWGSGWGHGGPAIVALMLPVSCSFLGRWNKKKLNKETTKRTFDVLVTALKPEQQKVEWFGVISHYDSTSMKFSLTDTNTCFRCATHGIEWWVGPIFDLHIFERNKNRCYYNESNH